VSDTTAATVIVDVYETALCKAAIFHCRESCSQWDIQRARLAQYCVKDGWSITPTETSW